MTAIADLPDIRPSLLLDFANSGRVDPRIECTRASSATCWGPDGKLRTVAANVPRIDYDPVTGKCLGLLVEESRTNLIPQLNNWTSGASQVIQGFDSPDPLTKSSKIVQRPESDGSVNGHSRSVFVSCNAGVHTFSVFVKADGVNEISVNSYESRTPSNPLVAFFDLLNNTAEVGSSYTSTISAKIEDVGGGWKRCIVVGNIPSSGSTSFSLILRKNSSSTFVGDGVSGVYVWGAQLEAGSFPTSYIPTEGTAVTRATDKVSVPYTTAGAGALFVHGSYDAAATSVFFPVRARSEGSGYIGTPYCLVTGVVARSGYVRNNGGNPSVATASGGNISTGLYKSVISWNGKNFANSTNGTISNSMTHELEFPICTRIDLCTASSSGPVAGASHIFQIAGYGAQLSPQNMQRLTA